MLSHLFNLLGRSFAAIPMSLGSTWLGIVFPVCVALFGELIGVARFGWQVMIQNWKKATGLAFAALGVGYAILFVFCFVKEVYTDHMQLAAIAGKYHQQLSTAAKDMQTKINTITVEKDGEIDKLKIACAYKDGASGILQQQLTNQQNQLNTCLLQQKEIPTMHTFMVARDGKTGPRMEYLLTTNVVGSPVDLKVSCDFNIASVALYPLTTGRGPVFSGSNDRLSEKGYKLYLESPAWSADTPLFVTVFFVPPVDSMPTCKFTKA